MKSTKDTLFFLTPDSEEEKSKKSDKKVPVLPKANGSQTKQKTVGGKVLRNQTRRAAHDEVHLTAAAKLVEHQQELHEKLQTEGLQRYSESGGGSGGKEGKGWKKFQSYKGEGALPAEVERMRVSICPKSNIIYLTSRIVDSCRSESTNGDLTDTRFCCSFPHQHHKKCK
jgi:nucleosome binding factor SPN SPT16 subunit